MCMKDVQEGVFKNQRLYKNGSINELSSYSGSINKFRVKKKKKNSPLRRQVVLWR